MKIPFWLKGHIDEQGLRRIRESVSQAEAHTTGEIVPMIVKSSSPKHHIFGLLFLLLIATLDVALVITLSLLDVGHIVAIQTAIILFSFAAAAGLSGLDFVHRILTPKFDRHHNAVVRAELEFHRSQIRATSSHTGALLFVSMMERQAVVLADEKIAAKLGEHIWDEVLKTLSIGLREKDFAVGFSKAIEKVGKVLSEHYPANEQSKNDLPNDLRILD